MQLKKIIGIVIIFLGILVFFMPSFLIGSVENCSTQKPNAMRDSFEWTHYMDCVLIGDINSVTSAFLIISKIIAIALILQGIVNIKDNKK